MKHLLYKNFPDNSETSIGCPYYITGLILKKKGKKKEGGQRLYPIKTRKELLNSVMHTRKINRLK